MSDHEQQQNNNLNISSNNIVINIIPPSPQMNRTTNNDDDKSKIDTTISVETISTTLESVNIIETTTPTGSSPTLSLSPPSSISSPPNYNIVGSPIKSIFSHLEKSALSRSSPNLQTTAQQQKVVPPTTSVTTTSTPQTSPPLNVSTASIITTTTTTTSTTTTSPINYNNKIISTNVNYNNQSHFNYKVDPDVITLGSFAESQSLKKEANGGLDTSTGIESNNSQLVGGISPNRLGKVFDHFLVVGLPSTMQLKSTVHDEKQVHKPQIIYKYPQDDSALPNDMVEQFCFPNGVVSRSSQRSYSSSSLNQVSFASLSNLLNTSHSFVFLLTSLTTLYYGVCIIKDEEVSSLPSFIDENSPLNQSKDGNDDLEQQEGISKGEKRKSLNRNQYDFIAPRVYCFLTRFPFFQLHFQMLHSILEGERMLMLFSLSQSTDPQNNGSSTVDLLNLYYNISMESVKDKVQFKAPCHNYKTDYHCPLGSEDRLIADWSLHPTFESLSIDDILNIYCWVLLERQVLVVSKHLGNISSLIFSFIPLLKPFVWQCCFIPVLPESLLESLDAPFPYIIGYPCDEIPLDILNGCSGSDNNNNNNSNNSGNNNSNGLNGNSGINLSSSMNGCKREYLIVDIDNKKLIYPPSTVPPKLPGKKKLKNTLIVHKKEMNDLKDQIPIDHLKHRFTQSITNTFREYQTWLVDQISTGVITCINNLYIQKQQEQANAQAQQILLHAQQVAAAKDAQQSLNSSTNGNNSGSGDEKEDDDQQQNSTVTSPNNEEQIFTNDNNFDGIPPTQPSQPTSPPPVIIEKPIENITAFNIENCTIDAITSIELLNRQSIHFLEDQANITGISECLPKKYQEFFNNFFGTQIFTVNAVKLMLSIQERHKTSISLIEKLESLILMEEKSKEVLMEYQKMAKKDNSVIKVDINTIKKQLRDSEGVINELKESKKKLEMEALATSPSKANLSSGISSLWNGLSSISELRKKKLEFGHRRSRSVTDQVEKNILKKSMKPPTLSFFDKQPNNLNSSSNNLANSSSGINTTNNKTSPPIQINKSTNTSSGNLIGKLESSSSAASSGESLSPKSYNSVGSSMPSTPNQMSPITSPILTSQNKQ